MRENAAVPHESLGFAFHSHEIYAHPVSWAGTSGCAAAGTSGCAAAGTSGCAAAGASGAAAAGTSGGLGGTPGVRQIERAPAPERYE